MGGFIARPEQLSGVARMLAALREAVDGFVLADAMGMGKTLEAAMFADQLSKLRVLFLVPLAVLAEWVGRLSRLPRADHLDARLGR